LPDVLLGCHLNISLVLKENKPWAKEGHEMCFAQFTLHDLHDVGANRVRPQNTHPAIKGECGSPLQISETSHEIILSGDNFKYTFDKLSGGFSSFEIDGKELLSDVVKAGIWRAPTDNDRFIKKEWARSEDPDHHATEWMDLMKVKTYSVEVVGATIKVSQSLGAPSRRPLVKFDTTYEVFANGEINVSVKVNVAESKTYLPRFGYEFVLNEGYEMLEYYGMGSDENYVDMCHYAKMGLYQSTVTDEYTPYIMPQEHGNHTKIKSLTITDKKDCGLTFTADSEFEFSALHYSAQDLTTASHAYELNPRKETFLRIDYKVSGIGSNSCGPILADKYRLNEKEFQFSFKILPK